MSRESVTRLHNVLFPKPLGSFPLTLRLVTQQPLATNPQAVKALTPQVRCYVQIVRSLPAIAAFGRTVEAERW